MKKKKKIKRLPPKKEVREYAILRFGYQMIADAMRPDVDPHTVGSRNLHELMRKLYIVLSIYERSMGELAQMEIDKALKGMDEKSRESEVLTAVAGAALLELYKHDFAPKSKKFSGVFNGIDMDAIMCELLPSSDSVAGREQTTISIDLAEKFYDRIVKAK